MFSKSHGKKLIEIFLAVEKYANEFFLLILTIFFGGVSKWNFFKLKLKKIKIYGLNEKLSNNKSSILIGFNSKTL